MARNRGSSCKQIGPTHFVVPDDDFASAFFELTAVEPVARCAFLVEDPDASFSLAADRDQARAS
jgi:hypothetical protein